MATINVSIDAKGNLVCSDINGTLDESITWSPDSTIRSIDSITTSVGSFNPAPSARNSWTGTLATDGSLPSGENGVSYTITVTSTSGTQKQKSPKISVNPPVPKPKHVGHGHKADV
jgi:hypothetical protein